MKWILIVMWYGASTSWSGKAAISVEFNDKPSCLAAADVIRQQESGTSRIGTIVCAAKGEEKK